MNGSASARSASPPPTLATLWRRDGSIRQSPAAPHPRPPPLATLGRRESLATFCGERFGGHSRQRRRCPLNGAPSKRAPSRRWAAFLAKYRPDASPKEPRTVKTPLRGKISPPCIQNELVLARYARYVFKMPRKAPLGNTPREYFAIKCPFSRPNPLNHAWRTNLAAPPHPGAPAGRILPRGGSRWTNPAILDGFRWTNPAARRLPPGKSCHARRLPLDESYRAIASAGRGAKASDASQQSRAVLSGLPLSLCRYRDKRPQTPR